MKRGKLTRIILSMVMMVSILFVGVAVLSKPVDVKAASSSKYYIKVNIQKCITTVYIRKGGKWKPYRCMYCCSGTSSHPTPVGTWTLQGRWPWYHMVGADYDVYVQNAIQVHGNYFLHSCCYGTKSKKDLLRGHFNCLGTPKTHGCIRFSVMDTQWIYDNCPAGTKITFYRSSNPGPLGKPKVKVKTRAKKRWWDPTDPDRKNPYFRMKGPTISFSSKKPEKIEYGSNSKKTKLMYGVTAMNRYANQDLTSKVKITKVKLNGKPISEKKYSTKKLGEYKVTYYCWDKYCVQKGKKGNSVTFTFTVYDKTKFTVKNKNRTVAVGQADAVDGVTAKALSKDMTNDITVQIVTPSEKSETMSYKDAKNYKFDEAGTYQITYTVTNPYPNDIVTETATVVAQ